MRKKPTHLTKNACTPSLLCNGHSYGENCTTTCNDGDIDNVCKKEGSCSANLWVSSVAVFRGSDLAASGAANGVVRLRSIVSDSRGVRPIYDYPLAGFISSLAFAKLAHFHVAGVGQEPQLGRWGRVPSARNGVAKHPIKSKEECALTLHE